MLPEGCEPYIEFKYLKLQILGTDMPSSPFDDNFYASSI